VQEEGLIGYQTCEREAGIFATEPLNNRSIFMGINYSALRAKEWEVRIRELEPKLSAKQVKAISVQLTKVDQARANLYTVLIDAGLDHESFEDRVRKL